MSRSPGPSQHGHSSRPLTMSLFPETPPCILTLPGTTSVCPFPENSFSEYDAPCLPSPWPRPPGHPHIVYPHGPLRVSSLSVSPRPLGMFPASSVCSPPHQRVPHPLGMSHAPGVSPDPLTCPPTPSACPPPPACPPAPRRVPHLPACPPTPRHVPRPLSVSPQPLDVSP